MKQIPIDLQEHYDGYATTTCHLIRIRNKDALIFALTDADHDIAYDAAPRGTGQPGDNYGLLNHLSDNGGASLSKTEAAADLSVGNAEIVTVPSNILTPEALMTGLLDSAEVYIYRINYMRPEDGHELLEYGFADVAVMGKGVARIAFRSQSDLLKEPQVVLWSKTCDHEFGGPKCPKAFVWTEGTITAVDVDEPARIFGSTISATDDFYRPGVVHVLTGANAGQEMEIDQNTGGTFALSLDLTNDFQIGDRFKVRQHCTKVYGDAEHGCLYWWGPSERNLYHGGCPDIPTADGGSSMVPGNGLVADDD